MSSQPGQSGVVGWDYISRDTGMKLNQQASSTRQTGPIDLPDTPLDFPCTLDTTPSTIAGETGAGR